VAVLLLMAVTPAMAQQGIDPDARAMLERSMSFTAARQTFALEAEGTVEIVLESGQKLQFLNRQRIVVQRPNLLYAVRVDDSVSQEFFYDGNTISVMEADAGLYAQIEAPPTIEGMLDFARDTLDMAAPAGDLLYGNAYDILMDGVTSGFVVGTANVNGVACDQLAFSKPELDFQLWIEQGDRPLVRRMVITSRDIPGAPEYAVTISDWDLEPDISPGRFVLSPPAGALEIEFTVAEGE
jgi:hypothetical protein